MTRPEIEPPVSWAIGDQSTSRPMGCLHKIHWDFEIQIDHLILARRPNLVIVTKNQKTCQILDFAILADHRVKLKEER